MKQEWPEMNKKAKEAAHTEIFACAFAASA